MRTCQKTTCFFVLFLVLFVFGFHTVTAELLEFAVQGTILDGTTDPDGDLPGVVEGASLRDVFRYDDATPELSGGLDATFGTYSPTPPFTTVSFSVGALHLANSAGTPADVSVVNDFDDPFFGLSDSVSAFSFFADAPAGIAIRPTEI